jgi:hypothetical protein
MKKLSKSWNNIKKYLMRRLKLIIKKFLKILEIKLFMPLSLDSNQIKILMKRRNWISNFKTTFY